MKNHKGFALLELFAIIALLSLVTAVAIPQIIIAKQEEQEEIFNKSIISVFTETYEKINNNIDIANKKGDINCSNYKYKDKLIFKNCKINWDIKNPNISDLKITVISNINKKWSYKNKTKQEIETKEIYNY